MNNTIIYVGGKSGGHIIPCLTLAKKEQINNPKTKIIFFAANTSLDKNILYTQTDCKNIYFLRFYTTQKTISNIYNFLHSLFICTHVLLWNRPKKIISSGGAISLPVCIAGWIFGVPIELYELNAVPGKAVLFLSRFATTIFVCFWQTKNFFPKKNCIVTNYPVRYKKTDILPQTSARKQLQLSNDKTCIMIIGGSQGSQFLNDIAQKLHEQNMINPKTIQIIHLVGNNDPNYFRNWYKQNNIQHIVITYTNNIASLYCASDIVISRAGAGTLAELLFFKKNTIIIPLETATTSHQKDNARAYVHEYPKLFSILYENDILCHPELVSGSIHTKLNLPNSHQQ